MAKNTVLHSVQAPYFTPPCLDKNRAPSFGQNHRTSFRPPCHPAPVSGVVAPWTKAPYFIPSRPGGAKYGCRTKSPCLLRNRSTAQRAGEVPGQNHRTSFRPEPPYFAPRLLDKSYPHPQRVLSQSSAHRTSLPYPPYIV